MSEQIENITADKNLVINLEKNKKIKKFISSALPYVNNSPHLGNVVGSLLSADVYAIFCRKMGYDTAFICGTDEYGTATEMEAVKQNLMPIDIILKNRELHRKVYDFFGLSFDSYGHTHCEDHKNLVQEIFLKSLKYFEIVPLTQYYCSTCEQFLADRYVEGECVCGELSHGDQCDSCGKCYGEVSGDELSNVKCVICRNEPEKKSTNHLYLRLDILQKYVETLDSSKWSENAKCIYSQWIKKEIRPRCMTRLLKYKWGVPVPLEQFKEFVFYVWFDAPIGYLTFLFQIKEREWLKGADFVQFMGKDNVPFHSVMFPSTLFAFKEYQDKNLIEDFNKINLSDKLISKENNSISTVDNLKLDYNIIINATEYLTFNGRKFSKSKKIGIFGMDLVNKDLGDVSKWRYYLMKRRPETKDADFNIEEFISIIHNELIANLGNFINRTLKYLLKKKININEEIKKINEKDLEFIENINDLYKEYILLMDSIKLKNGLEKVMEISQRGNKYLQELQSDKERMPIGYSVCYSLINLVSHCVEPYIPEASKKIFSIINQSSKNFPEKFSLVENASIKSEIDVIFTKFTDQQMEDLREYLKK